MMNWPLIIGATLAALVFLLVAILYIRHLCIFGCNFPIFAKTDYLGRPLRENTDIEANSSTPNARKEFNPDIAAIGNKYHPILTAAEARRCSATFSTLKHLLPPDQKKEFALSTLESSSESSEEHVDPNNDKASNENVHISQSSVKSRLLLEVPTQIYLTVPTSLSREKSKSMREPRTRQLSLSHRLPETKALGDVDIATCKPNSCNVLPELHSISRSSQLSSGQCPRRGSRNSIIHNRRLSRSSRMPDTSSDEEIESECLRRSSKKYSAVSSEAIVRRRSSSRDPPSRNHSKNYGRNSKVRSNSQCEQEFALSMSGATKFQIDHKRAKSVRVSPSYQRKYNRRGSSPRPKQYLALPIPDDGYQRDLSPDPKPRVKSNSEQLPGNPLLENSESAAIKRHGSMRVPGDQRRRGSKNPVNQLSSYEDFYMYSLKLAGHDVVVPGLNNESELQKGSSPV